MEDQMPGSLVNGGVLDVAIGVKDTLDAIRYWERFGYRVGQQGRLSVSESLAMYGHASAVKVTRLFHGDSDHGLIRLMEWETSLGNGLGLSEFKVRGSRWSAALVERIARPLAHAKYALQAGQPIRIHQPDFMPASPPVGSQECFRSLIPGAFEMAISQPLFRQVLFERLDADNPFYGRIEPGSMMRASQFTHNCIVLQGVSSQQLDFYDACLGLRRVGDFQLPYEEIGTSGKDILGLRPGEGFRLVKFDDPRSGDGQLKMSGRLTLFCFEEDSSLPDMREATAPGNLGHCFYTLRVKSLEKALDVLNGAGATEMTDLLLNEFNERSVLMSAPDGTRWMLVDASDVTLP